MSNDDSIDKVFDRQLKQLFANSEESLPAESYLQSLQLKLEQVNRKRQWLRWMLTACVVTIAAAITPWVVDGTLNVFGAMGSVGEVSINHYLMEAGAFVLAGAVLIWSRRKI